MSEATLTSTPCLAKECVAFTGTLASMTHKEAARLVEANGGRPVSSVSGRTTMLVVGDEGWPLDEDGQVSQKFELAESLIADGHDLHILSESDWLHLVGLASRDEMHRTYTPAMLSQLLDVPTSSIRRWERLGLIHAVRRVHRLPYFDFQEVAGVRRLAELLVDGISAERLGRALAKISQRLPGADRPLAQLTILVRDSEVVLRDERGIMMASSGQRLFDFEHRNNPEVVLPLSPSGQAELPTRTVEEWFYEGCRLADGSQPVQAIEAFRMALMLDAETGATDGPHPAEISFHLADALYCAGRADAALERYYAAVESDPNYLEAWIQLGCLLSESGETERAVDAFRLALDIHPDYPDAHLRIADAYEALDDMSAARQHWERYLKFDRRGPWAEHARQKLEATQ